jgi:N utilization substance protein A
MEIPEIYDGIVRIEKIVRETGMRTKVMVSSRDRDVDCVGACVGMKGSRIQAIVREIEGERIDIIEFSRDSKTLAENALTPAKVKEVIETRTGKVIAIVENEQKMIAVGKIGHNVRLASELCGFEITVMTEEEYRNFLNSDESRSLFGQLFSDDVEDYTPLQELGLKARYIELLEKGGIFSVEDLVQKSVDDLKDIDGIGEKTAKEIWEIVDSMVDFDDDEESEDVEKADEGEEPSEDESK